MLVDDLENLLVDGDGFEREALRRVVLADALVGGNRIGIGLQLELQVADLQQNPSIVGILLDDLLILRNRPVVSFLLYETLGGQENLLAVDRQCLLKLPLEGTRFALAAELQPEQLTQTYEILACPVKASQAFGCADVGLFSGASALGRSRPPPGQISPPESDLLVERWLVQDLDGALDADLRPGKLFRRLKASVGPSPTPEA